MTEKYLIAGLGNPGAQYQSTRHNIGFTVLEAFGRRLGITGKQEKRFNAIVGFGRAPGGQSIVLVQPLTYMNLSGEAIVKIMQYYQIPPERLLVIYDEAALPFGRIRFRPSGSDAGQKGMRSIIQCLGGCSDFPRLRIGIGSPPPPMAMVDFVLGRFSAEEQVDLPKVIDAALDGLEDWLKTGTEAVMARYNGLRILADPLELSAPKTRKPKLPQSDSEKQPEPLSEVTTALSGKEQGQSTAEVQHQKASSEPEIGKPNI
jgi:peptidyl-tRNA hydrolase, PTH1 family